LTSLTVSVLPKSLGNPYFEDCRRGAQEAAQELGFSLRWDGPERSDPDRQVELVERWTRERAPVVAVSVESSPRLTPVLRAARAEGVRVLTWDSDAAADARDFTIVHATPEAVAHALSFEVGRILGARGRFAAITSTLDAPNQRAWIAEFKARMARDHPGLELVDVRACHDLMDEAEREARALLAAWSDLRAIVGFCSPAVPGAAAAVKAERRSGVRLTGVSLPSLCRKHIQEGVVESVIMWNTRNLGYLVGIASQGLAAGSLQRGAASFRAGRLGTVVVAGDEIRLGRCHIVTKGNLDSFG
jgi:rhamnose transport system substrate-binding protein